MPEIKVENVGLKVDAVESGDITIIDATIDDMIENGLLDSANIPSFKLLSIMNGIAEHVGLTWNGAEHFDPLDRGLGGAIFMSILEGNRMSDFVHRDNFSDLRNWSGSGYIDTINYFSSPTAARAQELTSRQSFFDADYLSVRFYDPLGVSPCAFYWRGRGDQVLGNDTVYTVQEDDLITVGTVARSPGWHLLEVGIDSKYRVKVDGTHIFSSTRDTRQAFDIVLHNAIWDDFYVSKEYADDYKGGVGGKDDLKILDLESSSTGITYTVAPGYFYSDNIKYYQFANMGVYEFVPDPSGSVVGASGLPYVPGQPYFVVDQDDIPEGSGYVRTPLLRSYSVSWDQVDDNEAAYIPTISGAFDNRLVYEAGESREVILDTPTAATHLVLSDEGGTPASVRSESSYIDYVKVGNSYQVYAEVLDTYGGPVEGETVTWYRVSPDDEVTSVATGITNSNGVATGSIVVTEDESFHVYAEVNPMSRPKWIQVQHPVALVVASVFQFDNETVYFDSQEGTAAVGINIWHENWASNESEATGLAYPNPTTHGQWEALHAELERPPIDQEYPSHEPSGWWSGQDFYAEYPSIVDAVGTIRTFMDPKYVARNGYWGQVLVSGADIRSGSPTIDPGQVQNSSTAYEISRDYGATIGTYSDVRSGGGAYDSIYYVFYQMGSSYSGTSVDMAGNFYFRGVAIYEEDLGQANSQVQDIISEARFQE